MPHRLRYIPPRAVVEVTTRTLQSRFLLRPSPELNELILGVLGRAQIRYDVQIHAFVFLSNHYHMLVSPADAQALAKFMEYVNGNIAREAGRLHGWDQKFWSRRYQAVVVADEEAQWDRLRYILSHGCKEGLVQRPTEWPGVNCVSALTENTPLTGIWIDRSAAYEAGRRNSKTDPSSFRTKYTVTLTPLPCGAGMSSEAYRGQCASLVADIEHETNRTNAEVGRRPLGRAAVLRQHPHSEPQTTKRGPAPLVHAALRRVREEFIAAYRWHVALYRAAAERLRQGQQDVVFPPGVFPPASPFVSPIRGYIPSTSPPP